MLHLLPLKLVCFYRPYKGLKHFSNEKIYVTGKGFYRPYKGLKLFEFWDCFFSVLHVFIVPIRDWNLVFYCLQEQKAICFYRPYKGLKLKHTFSNFQTSICFYRPYKGLKHVCPDTFHFNVPVVFIVPIRDWNYTMKK